MRNLFAILGCTGAILLLWALSELYSRKFIMSNEEDHKESKKN